MENIETILNLFTPESYAKSKELTLCQFFACIKSRKKFLDLIENGKNNTDFNLKAMQIDFVLATHSKGALTWALSEDELNNAFDYYRHFSIKESTGAAINDHESNTYTINVNAMFLDRKQLINELTAYVDRYIVPNLQPKALLKVPDISTVLKKLHKYRALQYLDLQIIQMLFQIELTAKQLIKIIYSDSNLDLDTHYDRFRFTGEDYVKKHLGFDESTKNHYGNLILAACQQFVNPSVAHAQI